MKRGTGQEVLELATDYHKSGDLDRAESLYNQCLSRSIGNPDITYRLGTLHMERGNFGLGVLLLKHTLAYMPEFGEAYNNMGICLQRMGEVDLAEEYYMQAMERIQHADIPSNIAAAYVNEGQPEKVLEWAEKSLEIDPNHSGGRWNKALGLLEMQRFGEAWPWHESRLNEGSKNAVPRDYSKRLPMWDGSRKRVVIHGEQGLGDEIMFASCLPDAIEAADHIILECAPRLEKLFQDSFPEVEVVGTHSHETDPDAEAWIALGSLPMLFGRNTPEDFPGTPFLKTEALVSDQTRIGVAWQGGVLNTRIDLRSVPVEAFSGLFDLPVELVSLQYTPQAGTEVEGTPIKHWPEYAEAQDMDQVASLIGSCDLVVTVCQTAVHIAGALGVPCLVLTPEKPSWRYGVTGDMPWYESVKLIRGDWESALLEMEKQVVDFLGLPGTEQAAA